MDSENPSGADNQQETASDQMLELDPRWVVGFVDGEGCFSVSIHRNAFARSAGGYNSILSSTSISTRGIERCSKHWCRSSVVGVSALKGPRSSVWTFAVDGLVELEAHVVPFFERHPLVVKADDFERFAAIVRAMREKEHLTPEGFDRLVRLAYGMNFRRQAAEPQHGRDPGGILRDCTLGT